MDINSGRLVADLHSVAEDQRSAFTRVPNHLEDDAAALLAGRAETTLNVRQRNPVANWARTERKRKKNRSRNKIAKRSRAKGRQQ